MKFHISHSEMRRENMLYYVHCTVQFNEEEKAIIRARQLFDNFLEFKQGLVDYTEPSEPILQPVHFLGGAVLLFFIGGGMMKSSILLGLGI